MGWYDDMVLPSKKDKKEKRCGLFFKHNENETTIDDVNSAFGDLSLGAVHEGMKETQEKRKKRIERRLKAIKEKS